MQPVTSGQTRDLVQAAYVTSAAAVVGRMTPQTYDRRIILIALQGPAASTLRIYQGWSVDRAHLKSSVFPADDRLYDTVAGAAPILVPAGEALTFVWSGGSAIAGATATATITSEWRS